MANLSKTLILDLAVLVDAGTTKVVEAVGMTEFSALEYFVNIKSSSPTKVKVLKVLVFKTDTDVETQVYARRGDTLDIEIDAFAAGSNAELRIKNNESFQLEVAATRIIT